MTYETLPEIRRNICIRIVDGLVREGVRDLIVLSIDMPHVPGDVVLCQELAGAHALLVKVIFRITPSHLIRNA